MGGSLDRALVELYVASFLLLIASIELAVLATRKRWTGKQITPYLLAGYILVILGFGTGIMGIPLWLTIIATVITTPLLYLKLYNSYKDYRGHGGDSSS